MLMGCSLLLQKVENSSKVATECNGEGVGMTMKCQIN